MNERYPENYFEHYIVCFYTTNSSLDVKGFRKLAITYISIEGFDTFLCLIKEIEEIQAADDWSYFEEVAKSFEVNGLNAKKLKEMAEVAVEMYESKKESK